MEYISLYDYLNENKFLFWIKHVIFLHTRKMLSKWFEKCSAFAKLNITNTDN